MLCPLCAPVELQRTSLEETLAAHACPRCAGMFIDSGEYWIWREQHGVDLPDQADQSPPTCAPEPPRAKQCPRCRHLLLAYRVLLDLPFTLDHCGACNGVWLDRDEWAVLRRRNLHDNLHQMFGEPWQRRLREAERRARLQAIYEQKFGEGDYAELRRVKAWLDAHPQRQALRAYLNAEDPYLR